MGTSIQKHSTISDSGVSTHAVTCITNEGSLLDMSAHLFVPSFAAPQALSWRSFLKQDRPPYGTPPRSALQAPKKATNKGGTDT